MPNTLAHIGLHTLTTAPASGMQASFLPILLGSIIPDIPWIARRVLVSTQVPVDPYDLLAYATIQSSLFVSLLLGLALSLFFSRWLRAAAIISFGSLLHLILDAVQIKWGNGVNLVAPVDWELFSFGLIWPESMPTYLASALGIISFIVFWKHLKPDAASIEVTRRRATMSATLIIVYVLLPLAFLEEPNRANSHHLRTLQSVNDRAGKAVSFDRKLVNQVGQEWRLETYAREAITLRSFTPANPGVYSVRGHFVNDGTVEVEDWHAHDGFRDTASKVGIALVGVWLLITLYWSGKNRTA